MALSTSTALASAAADIAGEGILRSLFGIATLIAKSAENIRANKQTAFAISRRANEIVTVLAHELEHEAGGPATEGWREILTRFEALLAETNEVIHAQGEKSYLSQILHQERDRERLNDLSKRIQDAFNVLMLQTHMHMTNAVHAVAATFETSVVFDELKVQHQALSSAAALSPQISLPQRPALFFGRGQEIQAAVDIVCGPAAGHLVILGGPGMGKTTLALSVLHHPDVIARFQSRRYFIPCDASEGHTNCLNIVGGAFGIASSDPKVVRKRLAATLSKEPALIILDNFESAWEAPEQRTDAEALLKFLCDIDQVAVLVTLRGSERPQGVSWTRPFLPPLTPLDNIAATQTFLAISDTSENDRNLSQLLAKLQNVPLALVLMANLAQHESLDVLLALWADASTSILKRGDGAHRLNALDVSITLSLMSPRIQAVSDAAALLSLLSLLPRGVIDTDLRHWTSALSSRALPTLLQTALAYRSSDQRVQALAPIRAHMLSRHPPSDDIMRPLYAHYFGLAAVLVSNSPSGSRPKVIAAVAPELENLSFIIQYALKHSKMAEDTVRAAIQLCVLYHSTTLGPGPDLVADALRVARQAGFEELAADLLYHWGTMCYNSSISGKPADLYREARSIYERIGNIDGVLDTSTRLVIYMDDEESIVEGKRLWELAVSRHDARRVAACCHKIGDQYQGMGNHTEAISWYDKAIATMRETEENADRIIGYSMYQTATSYQEMGRMKDALVLFQEAMPYLQASENTFGICVVYDALGEIYREQGYWERSVENFELALKSGAMEYRFSVSLLKYLVMAYLHGDNEAGAMRALALLEPLAASPINRTHLIVARTELALWRGEWDEAQAAIDFALSSLAAKMTSPGNLLWLYYHMLTLRGMLETARGRIDDAIRCFITVAIVSVKRSSATDALGALAALAELVDDATALVLLEAVMPALYRNGWTSRLGHALLRSAKIASNLGDVDIALYRASNALRHFIETKHAGEQEKTRLFVDELSRQTV